MFDRFPEDAKRVMLDAREAALEFGHDYIGTEHLLVGLCANHTNRASRILSGLGVDPSSIRAEVEQLVTRGRNAVRSGQLPFTPGVKRVLELSMEAASARSDDYIGTEHLLLGLIAEGKGIGAHVLGKLGVDAERAGAAFAGSSQPVARGTPPLHAEALARAILRALDEARRRNHEKVDVPHLLLALLEARDGFLAKWAVEARLDQERLREALERALEAFDPRA